MGMFGRSPSFAPSSADAALPAFGPIPWSDRLMAAGAALGGDFGGAAKIRQDAQSLALARVQYAQRMAAMKQLNGLFGSQAQYQDSPAPSVSAPAMPGTDAGPGLPTPAGPGAPTGGLDDPSAAVASAASSVAPGPTPAAPAPYAYQPPTRVPGTGAASLADPKTQQTLLQAAMFGVPGAKEAVDILDKSRPTVKIGPDGTPYDERDVGALMRRFANRSNVNGTIVDLNDPSNTNRVISEAPVKGAMPVYDNAGRVVDWQLPTGSARAIGAAKAAEVGAQQAAEMPYVGPRAYATASGTKAGELPYAGPIAQATSAGTAAGSGPYENITVDVGGVPTTMSKAQFAALQGGQAPSASFGSAQAASALSRLLPGSIVTSGARSLNRNAAVGGVPDSLHTVDGAVDFVPPKGADINAFRAKLAAAGLPASELINEGNHWHWGFAPKGADPTAAPATGGIVGANKDDQKRIADLQAAAKQGEDLSQLGHQFMKLNGGTATGPGYSPLEVPIPFAHSEVNLNLPGTVAAKLHNGIPAMDNLSTQMALALRAPGQRITQMEFQKNLQSVPGKEHLGPQNMTVVKNYDAMAANRRAYADFATNWLAQHGSLTGMDQAFKAQASAPAAKGGSQAAPRLKWNPQTGALQ